MTRAALPTSRARRTGVLTVALALSGGVCACSLLVDTSGFDGPPSAEDASPSADGTGVPATDGGADVLSEASPDAAERDRYFDEVMSDGPVAYFRLSDTTPEAKNEVAGSAIGAVYPAIGATRRAPGALSGSTDGALGFDALTARLSLFGPVEFLGDVPFTVEAWVKLDDFSGLDLADDMSSPTLAERTGWVLFLQPNGGRHSFRTEMWANGVIHLYTQHDDPASAATFHHVVLYHSDVDHLDHLVVDGKSAQGGFTGNGIGQRLDNGVTLSWGGFRGTLDELAIYDKVLPKERIAKHQLAR